jgi:RNA polymerase sigma factor (sigma-70 family)
MNPQADDRQLLDEYVAANSHDAFAALVERHIGLVYAAARRRVGNAAVAEDIAQAVFMLLAAKAPGIRERTPLPVWLYTVTRYTCANAMKMQKCRQHHERRAAMEREAGTEDVGEGTEEKRVLLLMLDEAIDRLSDRDRAAVLLRFFEGLSFEQVALSLGSSPHAAEVRVWRAVEKLRRFFAARGVLAESGLVTATLTARAADTAPAAVAASVQSATASGRLAISPATISLMKKARRMMTIAKIKWPAVITAVCLPGSILAAVLMAQASAPAPNKAVTQPTPARVADLLQRFQTEYPDAAAKLEEAYSHARIDATEKRTENYELLWTEQIEFLREGKAIRRARHVLQSTKPDWPVGSFGASGGDGALWFDIYKTPKDKDFKFSSFGPNPDLATTANINLLPLYAAYSAMEMKLTDYLKRPDMIGISAAATKFDGKDLVEVDTEEAPSSRVGRDMGIVRARFYLLPHSWALAGWTVFSPDKSPKNRQMTFQERVEYQPDSDPPKMTHIHYWIEIPSRNNAISSGREDEISKIEFGRIPLGEFQATAVGATNVPK